MSVYDINGNVISGGSGSVSSFVPDVSPSFYDKICRSINHRGWTGGGAVENSLAAFKASKANGFYYVETDVRHTSDGYAILYHDDYINGTLVSNMTFSQVQSAVPTIAKFDDFIELCRDICLHPYIELKQGSQAQIHALVDVVHDCQMQNKCTWFGDNSRVSKVQEYDDTARLGILSNTLTSTNVSQAQALLTGRNEVFLDTYISYLTSSILLMVKTAGLPLEVFTFSGGSTAANEIINMSKYITGFTVGDQIAGKVLYDASIT